MPEALYPALAIHIATAAPAIVIGAVQLLRPKGDQAHRALGWIWAGLMMVAAISSFGIAEILDGWPSPIHILSIVIIVSIAHAMRAIRRGDVERHRKAMMGAFVGLLVAGAFTLLPSRFFGQMVWGSFGG